MNDSDRVDDFVNTLNLIDNRFGVTALETAGYRSVQIHDPIYCLYINQIRRFQLCVLPESRLDIGGNCLVDSWIRGLGEQGASRQCRR
jgi:hypothetical protein